MENQISCHKYFCGICEGSGKVPEVYYKYNTSELCTIPTGQNKNCPGCDGSGVSKKAQMLRDKDLETTKEK